MKKLVLICAAALASLGLFMPTANAATGELKFDSRFDHATQTYSGQNTQPNNSAFQVNRMRLDLLGTLGELTTYRIRLDLTKLNDTANSVTLRDKTSGVIDMAFLSRQIAEGLRLNAGKLVTGVGAYEGSLSSGDIYLPTVVWSQSTSVFYVTGVGLAYTLGDHTIQAMAGNPGEDETQVIGTTTYNHETRSLWGLKYSAKLFEGALVPMVTYYSEERAANATTNRDRTYTYLGVGGKYQAASFDIEADYLAQELKDKTVAGQTDKNTSMYVLARYKLDAFRPHVKYEISKSELFDTSNSNKAYTVDTQGLTVALEYVPKQDENFRYHVAYTDKIEMTDKVGQDTKHSQQVFVGVRMMADLLK